MSNGGALGLELVDNMVGMTANRIGKKSIRNAKHNVGQLKHGSSLAALRDMSVAGDDSAIIIAAGPSIKKQDPARLISKSAYNGAVVATDSALVYCLLNGIVPDLVVTLDPHAKRIVRWFGDPELTEECISADDYFSRQDMDDAFADELRFNRKVLDLIDEYGPRIKIALATSASEAVVNRVVNSGMQIFWWNPMLDDPDQPESLTRDLYKLNKMPCVNAGGNVGAACWMMAHAVLGKGHVALTGMDFSYYHDTPYERTQYYHEAVDLVGKDNLESIFIHIHNPYLKKDFYTDPAYMWYRESLLKMIKDTDSRTYNCTEGGILFGEGMEFLSLADFLVLRT